MIKSCIIKIFLKSELILFLRLIILIHLLRLIIFS